MNDVQYIIGYGTLLLRASLGSSIGQSSATDKSLRPVVVDGFIRVFNLEPDHYQPSYKFDESGIERAAMNVEPSAAHRFNGVAFATTIDEIEALDRREAPYHRVVVPMRDFHSSAPAGEGHLYVGREPWITRDLARLLPLWRDVVWGRKGAYELGEAFGVCFDETTYMGDGKTRVIDVYRELLHDTSDVTLPT